MSRPMKWHIYHKELAIPLVWDDKALEFDTYEDAKQFLDSTKNLKEEAEITQVILYYDGGYLNATGKIVKYPSENTDPILVDIERV